MKRDDRSRSRQLAAALGVALLYGLVAEAVFLLLLSDATETAGFWPPAGIALSALLLTSRRSWPLYLTAIAVAEITVDLANGLDAPVSVGLAVANVAECLVAALMVRSAIGERPALTGLREVLALFAAMAVGPAVGALIGGTLAVVLVEHSWWSAAGRWWVGDSLGMLVVTPAIVVVNSRMRRHPPRARFVEAAFVMVAVAVVTAIVFSIKAPVVFAVVPALVWASFRFGLAGASAAGLIAAPIAEYLTAHGHGPFHAGHGLDPLVLLQIFLATLLTTDLLLGATVAERRMAELARRESEERFRALVERAGEVLVVVAADGRQTFVSDNSRALFGYEPEALLGFGGRSIVHPEDLPALLRALDDVAARGAGATASVEARVGRADGATRVAECTLTNRLEEAAIRGTVLNLRDITEQRSAEDARQDLLVRLVDAEESERRRIAGDLHDGPVQQLSAAAMRLGALRRGLDDDSERSRVEDVETMVRSTVGELRSLLFELLPPDLEQQGLARAVSACADTVLSGRPITFGVDDRRSRETSGAVAGVAFRIVQEALVNVRAHAAASQVTVALSDAGDGLLIEVSDDGIGLSGSYPPGAEPGALPGHLGIRAMQERAAEAGGWCRVAAAPGGGTSVTAWLPGPPVHPRRPGRPSRPRRISTGTSDPRAS